LEKYNIRDTAGGTRLRMLEPKKRCFLLAFLSDCMAGCWCCLSVFLLLARLATPENIVSATRYSHERVHDGIVGTPGF
jgi:hypothetical protein